MADKPANRFAASLDFTSRAQKQQSQEKAIASFTEPESPLPDADPATLPPRLQAALKATGWKSLMPVQQKSIPYILEGRDLIVQSRTGSGKTGAFLLPLFDVLDYERKAPQALILSPTRELARQIFEEFEKMKQGPKGGEQLSGVLVYGGIGYGPQTKALREGAQVIIGTPGRILDHLERGTFNLQALKVLVLDEADEMLSMGFLPAMRQLRRYLPKEGRRSYMYSATMPPRVRGLADDFLKQPGFLSLSAGNESVSTLIHRYYVVDAMDKDRALVRLIEMENPDSAIVFANTKRDVEYVATFLKNYGYDAAEISGDLAQKDREAVMDRIRKGKLRFMVATDVAARGIDVSDLSHVFMYDVPQDPEYFLHRSGRTARAGKSGTAIVLAARHEETAIQRIAAKYAVTLEKAALPTPEQVETRVAERMTEVLEEMLREKSNLETERARRFVPLVTQLAAEEPEILATLVDQLYHEHLHVPKPALTLALPPEAPAAEASTEESYDEARGSQKPKKHDKGRSGRKKKSH